MLECFILDFGLELPDEGQLGDHEKIGVVRRTPQGKSPTPFFRFRRQATASRARSLRVIGVGYLETF